MRKVAIRFGLALATMALALPMMAKTDAAKTESKPKNATLTPLHIDMTHRQLLDRFAGFAWSVE